MKDKKGKLILAGIVIIGIIGIAMSAGGNQKVNTQRPFISPSEAKLRQISINNG